MSVQTGVYWTMNLSWTGLLAVFWIHKKYSAFITALLRMLATSNLIMCNIHEVCIFDKELNSQFRNQMQSQWFALAVQLLTNELPPAWQMIQFIALNTTLLFRDLFLTGTDNVEYSITIEFLLCVLIIPMNWLLTHQPLPMRDPNFWGVNTFIFLGYLIALAAYEQSPRLAIFAWQFVFALAVLFQFLSKQRRRQTLPCLYYDENDSTLGPEELIELP